MLARIASARAYVMPRSASSVWSASRSALGALSTIALGDAEIARQRPDLRLEQIAERIDRRRVVGVPGEISQQPFGLVSGADRQRVELRRLIEQHEHARARHHVAAPARVGVRFELQVAVDRRR